MGKIQSQESSEPNPWHHFLDHLPNWKVYSLSASSMKWQSMSFIGKQVSTLLTSRAQKELSFNILFITMAYIPMEIFKDFYWANQNFWDVNCNAELYFWIKWEICSQWIIDFIESSLLLPCLSKLGPLWWRYLRIQKCRWERRNFWSVYCRGEWYAWIGWEI